MKKLFNFFRIAVCRSLKYNLLFFQVFILGFMNSAFGQINIIPGGTVTENFTIGAVQLATLPTNWKVDKNTSVRTLGSYSSAVTATEQYAGNNMSSTAGNGIYNYGAGVYNTATDRSVGWISSSSATKSGNLYVYMNNNSALAITSFTISYNVEKYRGGTNTAGFSIQMYYSTDGSTWTSAGNSFLTGFSADASNNGYATAPGVTVNISNQTLTVTVPAGTNIYFAWNYSVTSGTTTSNAQGLGIDDVSITANGTSLLIPPTLTASVNASVDNPFDITFTDDVQWRNSITGITIDGESLNAGYSVNSGTITFTPSASEPQNLLQTSGSGKTITVTADGYSDAVVAQTINPGVPVSLSIKTQPASPSTNGGVLSTQPAVNILDQYGNTTTSTADVTASVGSGSWTIGGLTTKAAVNGTATFTNLTATSPSSVTGATITFTSTGLTGVTSDPFNIPAPSIDYISLTGTAYTQDFNTLEITGTGTTLPTGWYFSEGGSNANTTYTAGTGTGSTGDTYSFGPDGSNERCLGGLYSSSLYPMYGAKIKNSTGSELNSIKISYTGETWRVGTADRPDKIDFQYSTDATSLTNGTWIDVDILDYENPGQSLGNGSIQHSSNIIGKITGLSLANGSNIWIRWVDANAPGADDGMGIDDISISVLASYPTTQSNNVQLNYVDASTYNISWTKGNGSSSIVFVKIGTTGAALPEDGVTYNPNTVIGLGDQIGTTGWYCVYNGSGTLDGNVNITGFSAGQSLVAMVCEYNGTGTTTNYNTSTNATNPTSGVLPVSLSNFNYTITKNLITLKWSTANEKNNAGFEVERKVTSDNWTKIGFIKSKGNSSETVNYLFEDRNLRSGKYEYRLKQLDYNGNYSYFKLNGIAEVGIPSKYSLSQNYPNPFNPVTKIDYDLPFDSKVRILIYDVLGREVKTLVSGESKQAGFYTVELNAANMSSGMYFYRMVANNMGKNYIFTKKMIVIK